MARSEEIERRNARSTQLAASVGLALLFFLVYGTTNWLTAHRANVPTLFFEWERLIPFVPLMIVPYMSIDLLFFAAPFFCRNGRELATLAKRIAAALIVAGICFLLFPLRFAFERPPANGWLGALFDWFRTLDQPFNLVPSLHIAFCVILAAFYARRTRGLLRSASNIWFVLIGLSAVMTYQHHFMDVVGGFALGAYCLYFFPENPRPLPVLPNRRVGLYYASAAGFLCVLLLAWWPWGAMLLWPLLSVAIMAAAYLGLGPSVFRKRDGRLPWTTYWTLGPCVLGQYLSRLYYMRECRAWDELTPAVWIGRTLNDREARAAVDLGVTAVLDLTAEFSEASPFLKLRYLNIPILDLTAPQRDQLREMANFIAAEAQRGMVFIHCKIGYSRTGAAAGAYLLSTGACATANDVANRLRQVRPTIILRPEILRALQEFGDAARSRESP